MNLLNYQTSILQEIGKDKSFLMLDLSAGKTIIALYFAITKHIAKLRTSSAYKVSAVIFVKNNNVQTWLAEINKFFPNVITYLFSETLTIKTAIPQIVLATHSKIIYKLPQLIAFIKQARPLSIAIDESQALKNHKTIISKNAHILSKNAPKKSYRLALSADPEPEGPEELWSQFQWCYPFNNPLGRTYWTFLKQFFLRARFHTPVVNLDTLTQFTDTVSKHAIWLYGKTYSQFRRLSSIKYVYDIEIYALSTVQIKLLQDLYTYWELDNEEFDFKTTVLNKAQQVCSGFFYKKDHTPTYLEQNPKLDLLSEVVNKLMTANPDRKIIVWSYYHAERPLIIERLSKTFKTITLDNIHLFAQNQIIVMPATVTEGFNELGLADTQVFYSQGYSIQKRKQAEGRSQGLRQKNNIVYYIDLASNATEDMEIIKRLQAKRISEIDFTTFLNLIVKEKQAHPNVY